MIKQFNKLFNLPDVPFKRIKLENALIDKFGSIQYFKYDNWEEGKTFYTCGTKFEWETNKIESDYCATIEEALMSLFIKNGIQSELDVNHIEDYYLTDDYTEELQEIVRKAYAQDI